MKKMLFFFALLFMGAMTAFAQVPANEQLTYQSVVRNAQNQLVFNQSNVSVTVSVCRADGTTVQYSETHTGLSTNANGLLTLMVGGGTHVSGSGEWGDIDWTDASIKTVISYDPGTGTVTITSDPAPISAVPYALSAGNMSNITNIIGDAIHDSIVNNINNNVSEQIHDSIVYNIENTVSTQIHDSLTNALIGLEIQNCNDVNDCVANAIADGNSAINHAIDTVAANVTNSILTDNNYVTETVMGSAIHDSITNNVTNTISEQIHDSIVSISGGLTDLENRVNTFNTHVCDSVKDCVTGWIHDSIASNISDNVSEQIHDSITNYLTNNHYVTETVMGSAIHDSITNNVTNTISDQIHDSIVSISGDLTDLENRVNTFNTHVCDSVKDCVTGWIHDSIASNISDNVSEQIHDSITNYLTNNNYVTETVMGSAIHDSITNNVTNTISSQIHDSIVSISGDLTDLANRVNTFNTHVCDSVKDCIKDYLNDNHYVTETAMGSAIHDSITNNVTNTISEQIHDSIVSISGDLTDLENRVNTFNTHVCDSVKDCVTGWIHDSIASNIADNVSSQIHDSIVYNINNNISEQIHDSVSNYLTNNHYVTETDLCTTIETNCDNVALRNGNTFTGGHNFTGASSVTVPNAITPDLATTLASACTQEAVNLCDLLAVFDSLNRRINSVYDSLQRLNDELTALKNTIPPVTSAPTVSNVTSASMNVKANATSDGAAITSYEFCISTNSDMSGATCQTVQASDADNYTFTGLIPNINYYVQYSATNFAGTTTSASVLQRTPAHAPTANVSGPTAAKPAGFKVEVTGIDPKEKTDETTVQVCYKQSASCDVQENYDDYTCATAQDVASGITINTQTITGLEPSTAYCAIVKVSNGDSTTIYGPWSVNTGENVTMTVANDGGGTVNLCGESTKDVTFTATITGDNASDFTYAWSAGTSTTNTNTVALGSGSHTVNVTATHTTEGYTVTGAASVTVSSGGTAVSLGLCEWDGLVTVKTVGGSPNSIDWGDGSTPYSGTVTANSTSNTYAASGSYDIIATNASGCRAKVTMQVNVPGGTAASRTVKPCTVGDGAHTGAEYTGTGHNGANYGFETANGEGKITSVTDYDGNEYPVVQIGSQCWMAENLRVSHSPKTGSNLVVTAVSSYGSKMAAWYNNDQSTYEAKRYGLLYNWCAAMDTANPGSGVSGGSGTYVEVADGSNNNNSFNFTPSGNHQGVCPIGWHVPTDAEWNAMELEVNGSDVSGSTGYRGSHAGKLSTGCDWSSSGTENAAGNYANAERNDSGFSAVPAGYFYSSFYLAGSTAYFWSSSQASSSHAWNRYLYYSSAGVFRSNANKSYGFSVRCVRD